MDALAAFIIKYRKLTALVFLGLVVFSCFSMSWVHVETEIERYLPDTATAKQGLDVMDQEFVTYASGDLFVRNISQSDAKALNEKIGSLEGVLQSEFDANSETYYKDNCAKYVIYFSGTAEDQSAIDGKDRVLQVAEGYDATLISDSSDNYADRLVTQMALVVAVVSILVVLVLLLTSTTWAEVPVFLITFIAAAVINMGTHFLMGTISVTSSAIAVVLQLALSVDYAIILCNRYKEEHQNKGIEDAMRSSLAASIPAISASSLTTIAGLTAMTFMQFQLGMDMGIALIKAIVISLLTVFLLMPFLICTFGKWMDCTRHRSFIPRVDFLGKFAYATRFIIPPLFVVLAVFACFSFGQVKYDFDSSLTNTFTVTQEQAAEKEMTATLGNDNVVVLVVPSGDYATENTLVDDIKKMPNVINVTSIAATDAGNGYRLGDSVTVAQFMDIAGMDETSTEGLFAYYAAKNGDTNAPDFTSYKVPLIDLFDCAYELMQNDKISVDQSQRDTLNGLHQQLSQMTDQMQGDHYRCIAIRNSYPSQGDATFNFLDSLLVHARSVYGTDDVYMTGDQVSSQGFASTFSSDTQTITVLSTILVMLILLFTFRSVAMPVLLVLVIQGSIWINFALASWAGSYVFFMAYLIVSAIQMGANIDYAIVVSTRYNDMREKGMDSKEAVTETLNLAFPTVLTSGTMMTFSGVMIALCVSESSIAPIGQYLATGTLITLVLVNFVLPQILLLGDKVVQATTIHFHPSIKMQHMFRLASAGLLGVAAVCALAVPITTLGNIDSKTDELVESADEMRQFAVDLSGTAEKLGLADTVSLDYQYAESLLTDQVGSKELEEGQSEYDAGKSELDSSKAEWSEGNAEYQAALAEYNEGLAQLAAGQQQYDEGAAALAAAKQAYADGEAQYAQAQADYESGEAELVEVQPLYDFVVPYYNDYLDVKAQYDQAVADGDTATAESLVDEVEVAKAIFETKIEIVGYSIEELLKMYEDSQTQLAIGAEELAVARQVLDATAAQIADGERQLADGKAQIEAGQAQLDDAATQLAAARTELDDGASQIASGEAELDSAAQQLEEGKQTLSENKEMLTSKINEINSMTDDEEKLKLGIRLLESFSGVTSMAGSHASYLEVCMAAKEYFEDQITSIQQEATNSRLIIGLLALSALLGLASIAMFNRWRSSARWVALASAGGALLCVALWDLNSVFGILPFVFALILFGAALLFAVALLATGFHVPEHAEAYENRLPLPSRTSSWQPEEHALPAGARVGEEPEGGFDKSNPVRDDGRHAYNPSGKANE